MKVLVRLATAFVLVTTMHVVWAADVSGAWKGSFDFQGSSIAVTLNLKVTGTAVTGTVECLPTTPTEIHDGVLAGDTVTFWVNSDYEGQTYKLVYKGKIAADQITFDFGTEDGTWSSPLTVKKDASAASASAGGAADAPAATAGPDVAGNWSGSFDFNGTAVPVVFHLKKDGATVTGTIDGMGPAPTDIHEGKVEGDTLSFWVNSDYEGQTYTLVYKGKIAAGQIDFTFGTADGAWGSSVTAKKI